MAEHELVGGMGELNMVVQVTRKDTGLVEEYTLTGFVKQADYDAFLAASQKLKEKENG
jgi:hypothetical protein